MSKKSSIIHICFAMFLAIMAMTAHAQGGGQAPDSKVCNDNTNPPKDTVTQGGCIAIDRAKGSCQSCHTVEGIASGDIGPRLFNMAKRFPDMSRLRAQIYDPREFNADTVMPPYGKNEILSPTEIDKVIDWLLTL